jgi:hypothetical protein
MATTDNNVQYDVRFIEELIPYLNLSAEETKVMRKLAAQGWLQRDRIVEDAMAQQSKGLFEMASKEGMDFSDQSDAKSVVSNIRNNNQQRGDWTHSYEVRNIGNKVGALRVIAYNKILDKFHYFYIPPDQYAHLGNILTITCENYTQPNEPNWKGVNRYRKNGKTLKSFWNCECSTFREMCQRSN